MEAVADRTRTGLIIGKFMPPHRGHLRLIDVALQQVDTLFVLVCSLEREPIPGALRAEWVRTLAPRAHVVHVTDENPSEPHEHPNFWSIWVATIRRAVPVPIDVVFSSEDYGDELAARLGARHVMVDRAREQFPVSGSRVRTDPIGSWEFMPDIVRRYFIKRGVVTGSESTGKTTLAADVARHFGTVWVPEFARAYLDYKAVTTGQPLDASDIEPIARGQIEAEERAVGDAKGVLILDTDLVSTTVYARHYYGRCPEWIERAAHDRRADLYLLCDIDVPWVADPQRDRPHVREHMHDLFVRALESLGARYVLISGSWDDRRATAVAAVSGSLRY